MNRLGVHLTRSASDALLVGTLAQRQGRTYFQYSDAFLATGLQISPLRLRARPGLIEHQDYTFGPLPGVFDDSLPDGWGLLLMDRHFRSRGVDPASVSALDRLAWLGTRTMGALTYHPPADRLASDAGPFDLHVLARAADEVLAGASQEVLPQLLQAGGSPAGARPKVLVGYAPAEDRVVSGEDELPPGYEHWIVKFVSRGDGPDYGALEYAYWMMARAAGVEMSEARLFTTVEGDRFFGVRRFDRAGARRVHVHTLGGMIQSNFRLPSCDYSDLLKAAAIITRDQREVAKAFRQMVFNVLAHNRDDHVKNFAFVMDAESGQWILSPAYDVVFSAGPGGEHTMSVLGEGRNPSADKMLALGAGAGLPRPKMHEILDQVRGAVRTWPACAATAGVGDESARKVQNALASQVR